jgi:catechol-2,3-dioxygenase
MPRPDKFSHIVLNTLDVDRMMDWYGVVFDLEPILHIPGKVAIGGYDDETHRFAFMRSASPQSEGNMAVANGALRHFAYGYHTLPQLAKQVIHLNSHGISPRSAFHHGMTLSIYYPDPDGHLIEFFTETLPTLRECRMFMQSDEFRKNIVGYPVDLDDVVRQFNSGVSVEKILEFDRRRADEYAANHGPGYDNDL